MHQHSLKARLDIADVKRWMSANGISVLQLSHALGLKYSTVQSWLRGYSQPPRWLEQRINEEAERPKGQLPYWGKRWSD